MGHPIPSATASRRQEGVRKTPLAVSGDRPNPGLQCERWTDRGAGEASGKVIVNYTIFSILLNIIILL
jgi:hypothetical protein